MRPGPRGPLAIPVKRGHDIELARRRGHRYIYNPLPVYAHLRRFLRIAFTSSLENLGQEQTSGIMAMGRHISAGPRM